MLQTQTSPMPRPLGWGLVTTGLELARRRAEAPERLFPRLPPLLLQGFGHLPENLIDLGVPLRGKLRLRWPRVPVQFASLRISHRLSPLRHHCYVHSRLPR